MPSTSVRLTRVNPLQIGAPFTVWINIRFNVFLDLCQSPSDRGALHRLVSVLDIPIDERCQSPSDRGALHRRRSAGIATTSPRSVNPLQIGAPFTASGKGGGLLGEVTVSIPFRSGRPSQPRPNREEKCCPLHVSIPFRSGRPSQTFDRRIQSYSVRLCQSPSDRGALHRRFDRAFRAPDPDQCQSPSDRGALHSRTNAAMRRVCSKCVNPLQIGAPFTAWCQGRLRIDPPGPVWN